MFWLADHVRLFVHYTFSLASLCQLIWIHWTYKMPVRYILSSVWVRLSIFSAIHYTIYGVVCFQFIDVFVHYTFSLASLCQLIWIHWTYKMPVRYILSSVWVRLSIFSAIHYTIYGVVCFQFIHFLCDDLDDIYIVLSPSPNRKYKLLSVV